MEAETGRIYTESVDGGTEMGKQGRTSVAGKGSISLVNSKEHSVPTSFHALLKAALSDTCYQ